MFSNDKKEKLYTEETIPFETFGLRDDHLDIVKNLFSTSLNFFNKTKGVDLIVYLKPLLEKTIITIPVGLYENENLDRYKIISGACKANNPEFIIYFSEIWATQHTKDEKLPDDYRPSQSENKKEFLFFGFESVYLQFGLSSLISRDVDNNPILDKWFHLDTLMIKLSNNYFDQFKN